MKKCYVFWIKNALKISQLQCHWKGTYLLRYSPKNVQFRRYYFLIVLSNSLPNTNNFLKKFSWKSIYWKWYSIGILLLPNVYATSYFLKKLIHLLKVTGKVFDVLKPKSYLSRQKDMAHYVTYVNALFTISPVLWKLLNSYFPANFSRNTPS